MLTTIKRALSNEYVDYETYKNRIDFISIFNWQQNVRRKNMRNIEAIK